MLTRKMKNVLGWLFVALLLSGAACSEKKALTVVGTPTGEVSDRLEVILKFSKPMAKPDQVGKEVDSPLMISPPLSGKAIWRDPKMLVFMASEDLVPSTSYEVIVPAETKSLDGNSLAEPHRFVFFTKRIQGELNIVGTRMRSVPKQIVRVLFSQPVQFSQVEKHCYYQREKTRINVAIEDPQANEPSESFRLVPLLPLTLNADWNFTCDKNIRGARGNLGTEEAFEADFHTYGPLTFVETVPSGDDIVPEAGVKFTIELSNPLTEPYSMEIKPAVPGFPHRCHSLGSDPAGLDCTLMLEAHTNYVIKIDGKQKDIFGQTLGEDQEISFHTSDAAPTVSMDSGYFVAELRRPIVPIWTRNVTELDVTAVKITQANFHHLRPLLEWWDTEPADFKKSPLKPRQKKLKIKGTKNQWGQHPLDPAKIFGKKSGAGMYYLEVGSSEVGKGAMEKNGREKVLVNFTDIGVVSKLSPSQGLVWVTCLSTGEPLPGAKVAVRNALGQVTFRGVSDQRGIVELPSQAVLSKYKPRKSLKKKSDDQINEEDEEEYQRNNVDVWVSYGADFTMVNALRTGGLSTSNFHVNRSYDQAPVKLRGFMHTDRGLYRPGEQIHVKGLARESALGTPLRVPKKRQVAVKVEGPRGNIITETEASLSKFGGFWFDLDLAEDARLGDYRIKARLEHGVFSRVFSVEEFRPATFEVTGKLPQPRIVRRGELRGAISANYFYGAPLREGKANLSVYSRPRRVRFSEYPDFVFFNERDYEDYHSFNSSQQLVTEDELSLDNEGNATLSVPLTPDDISADADLLVRASVAASSGEVINKTFTVPYFRSRRYLGIKSQNYMWEVGRPQEMKLVALTPSGKPTSLTAKVSIVRVEWSCVWEKWGYRGSYNCDRREETVLSKTVNLEGDPLPLEFTPKKSGDYSVILESTKSGHAKAALSRYAYGYGDDDGSVRSNDSMTFEILTDKKEYRAGDTARLILRTNLAKASGLVTIERDGVLEKRLIEISKGVKQVDVPISASFAPNVYVSVALVQGRMGDGRRGQPRMEMGLVNLPVVPEDNLLSVEVTTDKKDFRPGAEVTAKVRVTDAQGNPVEAEVALTAVDEGVLSLTAYQTPNPLPTFYAPWGISVNTATQYAYLKEIPAPDLDRPATGGDSAPGSERSRFLATAVWQPGVVTDDQGMATVTFVAPDNLTAFRLMAVVADDGHRFGSTDKRFTVSKPLQLHQALPRFLTLGDEMQGGVVVHNETGVSGQAKVGLITDEKLVVKGESERIVEVPKGGRVLVPFKVKAVGQGMTELGFKVEMNQEQDAVKYQLKVNHPSSIRSEKVAHGVTATNVEIPLKLPDTAMLSTTTVHVSVDPDGLAGIEEGLRDLIGYPYGCLEQITSKVIPMIAVRSLAETLNINGLTGPSLERFVKKGVAKIGLHQTNDGGFSLWPGGDSQVYYTAYGLWGLHLAREAGYQVDQTRLKDGVEYLRQYSGRSPRRGAYYSAAGELGSLAFALYVRTAVGDKVTQDAVKLAEDISAMPIYGKAYLVRALAGNLGNTDPAVVKIVDELRALARSAISKDQLIGEADSKSLRWYMSSDMRSTAAVLGALVETAPKSAEIKPLVYLLMNARRSKTYIGTQANLTSLLALMDYAKMAAGHAGSVEVFLGDNKLISGDLAGEQRIKVARVQMSQGKPIIKIIPKGEVHYNIQISFQERAKTLKAQSNGMTLTREYLDKNGLPKTKFVVGDEIRVRLTLPLNDNMSHLMVSDRFPAGFEALNTRLATVGTAGSMETEESWGGYREMRDERVDFSKEYVWRNKYVREYMIRAIVPGTFVLPPAVSELMYQPEINSQTDIDQVEVRAK